MYLGKQNWAEQHKKTQRIYDEKERERQKLYYQKNREKVIDKNKTRYRKLRHELFQELGGHCVFCGDDNINNINFHHTVPMMVYESKIYHYRRNKDILVILCRKCHEQLHWVNDGLGIDEIFKP